MVRRPRRREVRETETFQEKHKKRRGVGYSFTSRGWEGEEERPSTPHDKNYISSQGETERREEREDVRGYAKWGGRIEKSPPARSPSNTRITARNPD